MVTLFMNAVTPWSLAEAYRGFRAGVRRAAVPAVSAPEVEAGSGERAGRSGIGTRQPGFSSHELEVQARWFGGEFGRAFTGTEGERIEIVQFGHWNCGAGPDFTEAAVRVDGELRCGAIEIDLHARDWENHGHGSNPAFDEVVLHVFTDGPALARFYTRDSRHRGICQLQLPQYAGLQGPPDYLPEAYPGRCVRPLEEMDDEAVSSLLVSAAQHRLQRKGERLSVMAVSTSREQALFQGVAEALGFRQNKTQMAVLTQRNPIAGLERLGPVAGEARLLGAAGFLARGANADGLDAGTREYLGDLWREWWKQRPGSEADPGRAIPWSFAGSRPLNHPQRRVGALAAVAADWPKLAAIWNGSPRSCAERTEAFFRELGHPFWERHYTLTSVPADRRLRLVGQDRCRDILGNLVLPMLAREDERAWEEYLALPGVGSNQKLRRARLRLFGPNRKRALALSRKYHQQQGLLQIFRDFCLEDHTECGSCPFPVQLRQWGGAAERHA